MTRASLEMPRNQTGLREPLVGEGSLPLVSSEWIRAFAQQGARGPWGPSRTWGRPNVLQTVKRALEDRKGLFRASPGAILGGFRARQRCDHLRGKEFMDGLQEHPGGPMAIGFSGRLKMDDRLGERLFLVILG